MRLRHRIGFVKGASYKAGEKLSKEDEKALKDSGQKYFELKEDKPKKAKEVKDDQ